MNAAGCVGRVGGLAVALGVGAAIVTGYGSGVAWADTPSSSESSESDVGGGGDDDGAGATESETKADTDADTDAGADVDTDVEAGADAEDETETDAADEADATQTSTTRRDRSPRRTTRQSPRTTEPEPDTEIRRGHRRSDGSRRTTPKRTVDTTAADPPTSRGPPPTSTPPKCASPPTSRPTGDGVASSFAARTMSSPEAAEVSTTVAPPAVPSLRLWPTAFDPITVVTYVTGIVSSLVNAVLSPFAAGAPALPADPPTLWTLLAWVRREFFNSSPTITYNPVQNSQTVVDGDVRITGNIGAADADDDQLTYTVIGRPLNGGVVAVDDDGNFTYRPMNAMAAVGGTDSFVVVVSDEAAGLHINGPLGLLQFVPIVGNFLNPGGGHGVAQTITVDVARVDGVDLSLPDDFHWGVAHSGFQAEGGPGSPVDPNSDWYRWVHDPINQLLGLTNGVPENGPGAYVNYDADAELAREELGMNTFRMGIEWSRIFPNSTAAVDISDEGGVITLDDLQALDALANEVEVQHYRDVLASLRAHGLEPMVTVTHFSLPTWVHDPITTRVLAQLGLPAPAAGWLSPSTPVEFEKYAAYLAWKYGDQVDNWATINEPFPPVLTQFLAIPGLVPAWPPGLIRPDLASTFLVNQAKAHVAAYDAIHAWDDHRGHRRSARGICGLHQQHGPRPPGQPGQSARRAGRRRLEPDLQPLVPQRRDRRLGRRKSRRHQAIERGARGVQAQGRLHGRAVLRLTTHARLRRRTHSGIPVPARPSGSVLRRLADVQRLQPADRPRRFP